eukprot:CAMPEP_0171314248 /NCGR_PEP_ID=MMETSP0816-20121228/50155_1 /TAXON_ID=420281 /ORGANISM="Proboscia inermis, Strain CCAP1064/1" /LENGTH=88 /DNA_ID=CAMNT_0011802921 /DNA_START=160 /DNA_END=429 /DNA_ORIENTATION=+
MTSRIARKCIPLSPLIRQIVDIYIDSEDEQGDTMGYDFDGHEGPQANSWNVFHVEESVRDASVNDLRATAEAAAAELEELDFVFLIMM